MLIIKIFIFVGGRYDHTIVVAKNIGIVRSSFEYRSVKFESISKKIIPNLRYYAIHRIIDNDIDSHISYCRVECANKKSIVARYFKLQTRSDVSRRN